MLGAGSDAGWLREVCATSSTAGIANTFVNATGDEMRTDGMLTVVQLADCANSGRNTRVQTP